MISMTKTRLGVLPCPSAGQPGAGAKAAFGAGSRVSWLHMSVSRDQSAFFVRIDDPITAPIPTAYNTTGVSAPPERSP